MSVAAFCRVLRCRWDNFARAFWPETPHERLRSELNRLDEELRRRQCRLLHSRQKLEELRDYLDRCERRLESLALELPNASVSAGAVERMERRLRTIERLRERFQERERAYERMRIRFHHRSRQWAELRDRLLSPALGCAMRNSEDESDLDYPF